VNSTSGTLIKLVNDVPVASYSLSNGAESLVINTSGDVLYFLMDAKVFQHKITDTVFKKESVYDGFFYNMQYNANDQKLYLCDAKDFTSTGEVLTLNPITKQTSRIAAGIIPGFVYIVE
jgi:hypothetical protein